MTIRVLIVEDSRIFQRVLSTMLKLDPEMEVVGIASDPYEARDLIIKLNPDVTTLDINLPRMNGLDFLKRIMQYKPIPVVIISSLTHEGSQEAMDALALGAAEVLPKPSSDVDTQESSRVLCQAVRAAAVAQIQNPSQFSKIARQQIQTINKISYKKNALICIGASTGGTEAIKQVLLRLPNNIPPVLIAQHMPAMFTKSFAERLNALTPFTVIEAAGGEAVQDNHIYIAPGGFHLKLVEKAGKLFTELDDGPRIHFQRPAVDVLFDSVARVHRGPCVAALLTGMGADGADGMQSLFATKRTHCIAQDEQSCVVYGMPRVAVERHVIHEVLPIDEIGAAIAKQLSVS